VSGERPRGIPGCLGDLLGVVHPVDGAFILVVALEPIALGLLVVAARSPGLERAPRAAPPAFPVAANLGDNFPFRRLVSDGAALEPPLVLLPPGDRALHLGVLRVEVPLRLPVPPPVPPVRPRAERDDDEEHRDARDDAFHSDAAHSRAQIHAVIAR